jgi:glycosyltransferase involved in cell wall biosynthesis
MIGRSFQDAANGACTVDEQTELPMVSVAIKALNEEAKIGRCIESALAALREIPNPSEVILADSISTDRTVEIARSYPITIVQFRRVEDRGCGAAVQLGYQHSRGDFVMLLDGDMALLPGFLPRALAKLAAEPRLAGVAGLVEDTSIVNEFDRNRVSKGAWNTPLRPAKWLNGGGLYRRAAIAEAGGYAADRSLKAWEEAELGMRLTACGWSLERIDYPSTLHTGHAASAWHLLRSMWRSRRAMSNGVLLKQAVGKPWMLKAFALLIHPIMVILLWTGAVAALAGSTLSSRWGWTMGYSAVVASCVVVVAVHKRGLKPALTSIGNWHYSAAALLLGLREATTLPTEAIESIVLSPPSAS